MRTSETETATSGSAGNPACASGPYSPDPGEVTLLVDSAAGIGLLLLPEQEDAESDEETEPAPAPTSALLNQLMEAEADLADAESTGDPIAVRQAKRRIETLDAELLGEGDHQYSFELRRRYIRAEADLAAAEADGDRIGIRRAKRKIDDLGNEFIARNRGLAITLAKVFFTEDNRSHQDDYASEGQVGLWEAFTKWDPERGTTIGTFSRRYIAGRVGRAVKSIEFNNISYSDWTERVEVRAAAERLEEELGRAPSNQEIAAHTGHTLSLVERVRMAAPTSLDNPVGDGESSLGDLVPNTEDPFARYDEEGLWREHLRQVTLELTARELLVLCRRSDGYDPAPVQSLVEIQSMVEIGREALRKCELKARTKVEEQGLLLPVRV